MDSGAIALPIHGVDSRKMPNRNLPLPARFAPNNDCIRRDAPRTHGHELEFQRFSPRLDRIGEIAVDVWLSGADASPHRSVIDWNRAAKRFNRLASRDRREAVIELGVRMHQPAARQ